MKKKYSVSRKDKKDWTNFTKKMDNIFAKEDDSLQENQERNKIRRLDLHGYSLEDGNKVVKKFIIQSFNKNYRKLSKRNDEKKNTILKRFKDLLN